MTPHCALVSWLALAFCTACGAPQPNLLLVVVDTLRADHLGSYGHARDTSPRFDALAAAGVRFERAYASAPWTMPSVASILTGLHPSRHGLVQTTRPLAETAKTLAERLSDVGYRTGAVTSHILLEARYGFDQGFDIFHERAGSHHSVTGGNVTRAAMSVISDFTGADAGPFFLFVHYFDPHYAYRDHTGYAFAGRRAGRVRSSMPFPELLEMRDELTAEEIDFVRALYDEEVRYTDEQLDVLLQALTAAGAYEDTLIVVTADHGEEFMEHGWIGHTTSLHDTLLRVPLVLKPARHAAGEVVVGAPVSLVSLAPTLLDMLDVPAEAGDFDGVSLAPLLRRGRGEAGPVFSEVDYQQHRSLRASQRMLVVHPYKLIEDRLSGRSLLFDLVADPGEQNDLAAERPELVESLHAQLEVVAPAARTVAPPPALSDEARRQLYDLGYAE